MHSKQLDSVKQQMAQLQDALTTAQQALGSAVETLGALGGAVQLLAVAGAPDRKETLEHMHTLEEKQHETLQAVRERGKGFPLQKTIETDEQRQLVAHALNEDGPTSMRSTLARFRELQQQEYELLHNEIGMFEAQGMRELLNSLLELSKQQEEIARALLERKSLAPESGGMQQR
jgi:hypothetical protein